MIKGKTIEEKLVPTAIKNSVDYRSIDALNYSSIKLFDEDPLKFYNEFILKQKKKTKISSSLNIGALVDFYLIDCHGDEQCFSQSLDEKFALFEGNKGSGQDFLLADYIFELTERDTNEKGILTSSFLDRFEEAFNRCQSEGKFKGKEITKVITSFSESDAEDYLQERIRNIGKCVVDLKELDKAKSVVNNLKEDEFHSDIINAESNDKITVFKKLPIEFEYVVDGGKIIKAKAELDFVHVFEEERIVQPYDMKSSWDNEGFDYSYLKYQYYLQNAFYYLAVESWLIENEMIGYKILPMKFLAVDTSPTNRRPLIYETSLEDRQKGLDGFTIKGYRYRGLTELINEINWSMNENIWNISKTNYDNKGIVKLSINYE